MKFFNQKGAIILSAAAFCALFGVWKSGLVGAAHSQLKIQSNEKLSNDLMWRYGYFDEGSLSAQNLDEAPLVFRALNNDRSFYLPVKEFKVVKTSKLAKNKILATVEATYSEKARKLLTSLDASSTISPISPETIVFLDDKTSQGKIIKGSVPARYEIEITLDEAKTRYLKSEDGQLDKPLLLTAQYEIELCETSIECKHESVGSLIAVQLPN